MLDPDESNGQFLMTALSQVSNPNIKYWTFKMVASIQVIDSEDGILEKPMATEVSYNGESNKNS